MSYIATLLRIEPNSNPEYALVPVPDESSGLEVLADKDLHGLGWTSYADTELWGKDLLVLVDVVSEEDHVRRSGKGNTRGSESQDARFERYRKAVLGDVDAQR